MGVYKYCGPWVKGDRDGCLCMGHGRKGVWGWVSESVWARG